MTALATPPKEIFLSDYTPPAYLVEAVHLFFDLDATQTTVRSVLKMRKNPKGNGTECILDGEQLELISIKLNGQPLEGNAYQRTEKALILTAPPEQFELEIETQIYPDKNTALEGLYHSGNLLCTQCEAQGFRRITYYPDRPDVMAIFTVSLVADKSRWPILLSNGNLEDQGVFEDGRHWVRWHDPYPKPSYLFALVAGDLYCQQDSFTTLSGRVVKLEIFVDHENSHKCDHALQSLKQAMKWDEERYGREYDLDVFMIVAVNDFNMGAMENKGLNIFNASCVLASPETATDQDYYRIQGIVGHEYFHNWSGNRVTCRDWFQLSLKEGFTVFRDQEFSADMNSAAVQRIHDVEQLRTLQFVEDAGPMAHPVRPASFIEISNFYTVTIYEKGAEVVRMIQTIVGKAGFRKGTDLYFSRHDGQAVTTDDFVKAMEDANQVDLTQFKRWYTQAGTPELTVTGHYDEFHRTYTLTVEQSCPPTPGQPEKRPFYIPLAVGLLDQSGHEYPLQLDSDTQNYTGTTRVLAVTQRKQSFTFVQIPEPVTPSLLRQFSAPVKVHFPYTDTMLAFLMSHDSDSFTRWDAGQTLIIKHLMSLIKAVQEDSPLGLSSQVKACFEQLLSDSEADPALIAQMLALPDEMYLASQMDVIDVDAIHQARTFMEQALAQTLRPRFEALYQQYHDTGNYQFNAEAMGRRSLKNRCLAYLMATREPLHIQRCLKQMKQADNMTDLLAGLKLIAQHDGPEGEHALRAFYEQWQHDPQVVDKWLAIQAQSIRPNALLRVKALLKHPAFQLTNPNHVRALIGQFSRHNPVHFHAKDGSGYQFLTDQILQLDKLNPQMASRLLVAFNTWRHYDPHRKQLMQQALTTIASHQDLSADVYEVVNKYLAD